MRAESAIRSPADRAEGAGAEGAGAEDAGAEDAGAEDAGAEDAGAEDAAAEDAAADDAAVMAQSIEDPECFAVLFRRHAAPILRYVTRRIGSGAAEDVVAETFLVAFRQRGGYRSDRPDALPWLYGIATNLIGRHRRSELRQLRLLARTGADPVIEPFTERVDAAVSAGSAKARLGAALARLPAAHRDALLLVAWGGLTYEQVAIATGAPLGTVRSRVSRARRKLRQSLGDLHPAAAPPWTERQRPDALHIRHAVSNEGDMP
jgi:RNA polymerase sigma factor (sigma-70 family)